MASIQVKREESDMSEMLTRIKQMQSDMSEMQNMVKKLIQRQEPDMTKIIPKIIKLFDNVEFVKQVCYENDINDEIKLVVIYDHDDSIYSEKVIFKKFFKLVNMFSDIYMEIVILHTSEVGPDRLNSTITVFKSD